MDRDQLIAELAVLCAKHSLVMFIYSSGGISVSDGTVFHAEGFYMERKYAITTPERSLTKLLQEVKEHVNGN